jgi:hypothetical protein
VLVLWTENRSDSFPPDSTANSAKEEGITTQIILPLVPAGTTAINEIVRVLRDKERWTYFVGTHSVYYHHADNVRLFRLVTAQLIESGACKQIDIIRTLGVARSSVAWSLKKLCTKGIEGFMRPRKGRRGGAVFISKVLSEAQDLLNDRYARREVADELGIHLDTLRKAITSGRLTEPEKRAEVTDKSSRTVIDAAAADGMGTACTRIGERFGAAIGKLPGGAQQYFEACHDVPYGGVLCALPSLVCNGLFDGIEKLAPGRKGLVAARSAISDEFFAFAVLRSMPKHRIRTGKVKNRRKSQASAGLGRMRGICGPGSVSQYHRGINVADPNPQLTLMRSQRGPRYLFDRGQVRELDVIGPKRLLQPA